MKRYTKILIFIFTVLSIFFVFENKAKADNAVVITQSWYDSCSQNGTNTCSLDGEYKLGEDIIIKKSFTIVPSKTVTIDLAGHEIKANDAFNGNMFDVRGSLTLNDTSENKSGSINGGLPYIKRNTSVRCFYVNNNASLTIIKANIKNMCLASNEVNGAAIINYGTVSIQGGTISNCHVSNNGGAIYNMNKLDIDGCLINNCSSLYSGGAIFTVPNKNEDITVTIKNTTIEYCRSSYGGAIYNSYNDYYYTWCNLILGEKTLIDNCSATVYGGGVYNYAKLTINDDVTISNCTARWAGGILNNYNLTINGGLFKDCSAVEYYGELIENNYKATINGGTFESEKLQWSAIYTRYELSLNGKITFNNLDSTNFDDDICVDSDGYIAIGGNFQTNGKKISIKAIPGFLGHNDEYSDAVKLDGYQLKSQEKLKDIFKSSSGQEFLIENTTDHTLSIKSVQIYEQPSFSNGYTAKTDIEGTPIKAEYQWYKANILEDVQIGETGDYGEEYLDFSIFTKIDQYVAPGKYKGNYKWTMPGGEKWDDCYMFAFGDLKGGEYITFDYDAVSDANYICIAIEDDDGNIIDEIDTNKIKGSFRTKIPSEGDYWLFVRAGRIVDYEYSTHEITISNIYVEKREIEEEIEYENTLTIFHPEADADIFLRATFTNPEGGSVSIEDSKDVKFGKVLAGDNQYIKQATNSPISFVLDTSDDIEYKDVKDMVVYVVDDYGELHELDKESYFIFNNPVNVESVSLTLTPAYVRNLSKGKHTFFVVTSDEPGKECTITNLMVTDEFKIYWGIDYNNVLHISTGKVAGYCVEKGETDGLFNTATDVPWIDKVSDITSVVIDDDITPIKTRYWFKSMENVKELDLTGLDTSSVVDMLGMFDGCTNLETIKVSPKFDTSNVTVSTDMFKGCTSLIGGNGTIFNSNKTDVTYARYDNNGQVEKTPALQKPGYFTKNNKLLFDSNGTGVLLTYSCKDLAVDEECGLLPSATTKLGYNIKWYENAQGTGNEVTSTTKMSDKEITIYAKECPNNYKVAFNPNRPSSASAIVIGTMIDEDFTYDDAEKTLTKNSFALLGWTFSGWNNNAEGTGTAYTDEQAVKNLTTDNEATLDLYAVWTPNTYTVKYDSNGGQGSMNDQVLTFDDDSQSLNKNSFTKSGYEFIGWSDDPEITLPMYEDESVMPNISSTNDDTVTLYAVWKKKDDPAPTPSPAKKDESCEKVIGSTWHWNNKKGICEDSGSVKTNTKISYK